jgi:hypothetical protein
MNFTSGGSSAQPGSGWITYLTIIGGLVLFINLYAKANDNYVTFGNLFSYGFKTTAALTAIFIVFMIILILALPEFKQQTIEASRIELEKRNMTDEQIEQSLSIVERNFWVFAIGGTMLSFVIIGAIGSLIGAAITKKRPVTPFDQSS